MASIGTSATIQPARMARKIDVRRMHQSHPKNTSHPKGQRIAIRTKCIETAYATAYHIFTQCKSLSLHLEYWCRCNTIALEQLFAISQA